MRWAALILLAGCGVQIEGGKPSDGSTDAPVDARADAGADARPCTGGDMHMTSGGSCYLLFTGTPRSWDAANTACINMAAHLAIIDTAAKETTLKTFAGLNDVWIGLTDVAVEMQFRWVDVNVPFVFTAWDPPNEPSNGQGAYEEDCVLIAGKRGGDWDDRPCSPTVTNAPVGSGLYSYMCEF
jgi:hypothetical protein